MTSLQELEKIAQTKREENLRKRTLAEKAIDDWVEGVMKLPEKYRIGETEINHENINLKKLMPEWYEEKPNAKVLESQRAKTNEFFATYNRLSTQLQLEAEKELMGD
jgi:hypothetical protein